MSWMRGHWSREPSLSTRLAVGHPFIDEHFALSKWIAMSVTMFLSDLWKGAHESHTGLRRELCLEVRMKKQDGKVQGARKEHLGERCLMQAATIRSCNPAFISETDSPAPQSQVPCAQGWVAKKHWDWTPVALWEGIVLLDWPQHSSASDQNLCCGWRSARV